MAVTGISEEEAAQVDHHTNNQEEIKYLKKLSFFIIYILLYINVLCIFSKIYLFHLFLIKKTAVIIKLENRYSN